MDIEYICENYNTHHLDVVDYLKKYEKSLNKKNIQCLLKSLYFSQGYQLSKINISKYLPLSDLNHSIFLEHEKKSFDEIESINPSKYDFLYFLLNDKISYDTKIYFIENKNISNDFWYDVILESMRYNDLTKIESFLIKYIRPESFNFEKKYNFYNFIINGDNISFQVNKNDRTKYIDIFIKLGFNINDKDISGEPPLYNAIKHKEKKYILSIIKNKPICDIFVGNDHLWAFYLKKMGYEEYNYNIYSYFLKKTSDESLKTSNGKYYLAGILLNRSNSDNNTRKLIKKCFSFYCDKNSFGDISIRERLLNHKRLSKIFIEEETIYLKNKIVEVMHASSPKISSPKVYIKKRL